jgi:hypothetical protein
MDFAGRPINKHKRSHMGGNYLSVQAANNIFVNESGDSMEGPLDMKNNKIINIIDPEEPKDCCNKSYVDKSVNITKTYVDNTLTTINRKVENEVRRSKTDIDNVVDQKLMTLKEPISRESAKYIDYIYILNVMKPKFWFTSFLPDIFNYGLGLRSKGVREFKQNTPFIKFTSNDYVISEYEFRMEYTFIGVVRRITQGRVFTSLTGKKFFGFWKAFMNVVWHDGPVHMNGTSSTDDIQMFIYTSDKGEKKLYNNTTLIYKEEGLTGYAISSWGNLVIGDTLFQEGAEFELYDCIGFDRKLSNKEIIRIRNIIRI